MEPDIATQAYQVRAASLNELIYKQGQAGITKASVTLVFDNSDPELAPHGYEQLGQITVTRQVRRLWHRHFPPSQMMPAPPYNASIHTPPHPSDHDRRSQSEGATSI